MENKPSPSVCWVETVFLLPPIRVRNNNPAKRVSTEIDSVNWREVDENSGEAAEEAAEEAGVDEMDETTINGPPTPKVLWSGTMFATDKPDGANRDVIIIECNKINDQEISEQILWPEW